MKKFLCIMLLLLSSCNIQKDITTKEAVDKVENNNLVVKVVEYDTTRIFFNDTIYQPIKKIVHIKSEASKEESTIKEEQKEETTKSEFSNYLIAFGCGVFFVIVIIILIFFFRRWI